MATEETDVDRIEWGKPIKALRLGVAVKGVTATLHLENTGQAPLSVLSHVIGGEVDHLDFFTVVLTDAKGAERTLFFVDDREESEVVTASLRAGEGLRHTVNLGQWARRAVNGGKQLAPGDYRMKATYRTEPRNGVWIGSLEAGPITLKVPDLD